MANYRYFNQGPPSAEDRLWDCLSAWYWGQKDYAILLMTNLVEDEIDNKGVPSGEDIETSKETLAEARDDIDWDDNIGIDQHASFVWPGWQYKD